VEEEEAKINTKIVAALSAIATIKVKVKGMAVGVEATTTTTKGMVEDRVHQDKVPTSAKAWMYNPTCSLSNTILKACSLKPVTKSQNDRQ